jgi:DNA-binding transcriptional ArsR family regulator
MTDDPVSRRVLRESDLVALAHPLRLRLLEVLDEGPSTASRLARRLGESSGATSYHLRALARFGFVEEAEQERGGRERWWRRVPQTTELSAGTRESPEYQAAATQLRRANLDRAARIVGDYLRDEEQYPEDWREAALFLQWTIYATPEELRQLAEEISELLEKLTRVDPAERPAGAERAFVTARAVPWWV